MNERVVGRSDGPCGLVERRAHNPDPRAQERAAYEASLRRAAEESRDTNSYEYEMNKMKCSSGSNILGDFLYEVKGNRNGGGGGGRPSAIEVRPVSAGPPPPQQLQQQQQQQRVSWHSNFY